ncbi:YecR family lipoprotein [Kosakonia sp. H02]|nr:YecR family lipoprotein [Kosakonia sp. H02]
MKILCIAASLMLLAGCTLTKEAEVSSVDTTSGLVRLSFNQTMMQNARYDEYTAQGTANKQCQQMGYATAVPYGQPVQTCSLISGSACMNTKITIQYQCRGVAFDRTKATW